MDFSDKQLLYKIVCSRDKRYDGRFFCGVRTTGIYCRPVCPARPKLENILFFRSAAEAEKSGYRACLRCRPDLAPSSVQWQGTAATVSRALMMIARGDADENSLDDLAKRLGVSDRHLRRLFEEHVGASPSEVAGTKRLQLAKQLLLQSSLSITDVAFAAGFRSIRRFNEAFKEKYGTNPTILLRSQKRLLSPNVDCIRVEIPVIPPFDWQQIYSFLQNHAVHGIERIEDQHYKRCFSVNGRIGAVDVQYDEKNHQLIAMIHCEELASLRNIIERVRDLFDVRLNPHAHLKDLDTADPVANNYLKELGIRVPGAWDPFETAICIILGQLVSVEQAQHKIKKLVAQFGQKTENPVFQDCTYLFPTPKTLAYAELGNIGITKTREQAIRGLSQLVFSGSLDLSRTANLERTRSQLLAIKGIGPWTAEMIAMRCLGDTNAFPKSDLIIKRALDLHKIKKGDWSPWNSYISLALWKKYAHSLSQKKATSLKL